MTTTAAAAQSTGLVVMLEAAGRTIAGLELEREELRRDLALLAEERAKSASRLEELTNRLPELEQALATAPTPAELAAAHARIAELEEHARTLAATDGEQLTTVSDGAPDVTRST